MRIYNRFALVISNATPLQVGRKYRGLIAWIAAKFGVIPLIVVLAAILVLIFFVVQTKTKFGKYVYAIGANETAARMAGVKIARNKVIVFTLAGLCYALGGIILTSRLKSGIPTVGNMYTLMSIAAVAFGGTSLSGGKGGLLSTILGAALIITITNGMIVVGIDAYWQQIVYGAIIIISLCTTSDRKNGNLTVK
jgi:ribose transport system permease protein